MGNRRLSVGGGFTSTDDHQIAYLNYIARFTPYRVFLPLARRQWRTGARPVESRQPKGVRRAVDPFYEGQGDAMADLAPEGG